MPILVLLVTLPLSMMAECLAVDGDRILARHLTERIPAFASVNPDEPVALAPAPGAERILNFSDLRRVADRTGVPLPTMVAGVCVRQAVRSLSVDAVESALRASLKHVDPPDRVRIELIDYSRHAVPNGRLEFPISAVSRPAGGDTRIPVYWRGRIVQPGGRSYPVWAKVRVSVRLTRIVAAAELPAGVAIDVSSLRLRQIEEPPGLIAISTDVQPTVNLKELAGRLTRRKIRAGEPIHDGMLLVRRDVGRGQSVAVEVRSGAARLTFEARAESAGKVGDQIVVRNQATGKRFRATIDGPGQVSVETVNEVEDSNASKTVEMDNNRRDRMPAVSGGTQAASR